MALIHLAKRAQAGDRIVVTYDSTRSDEPQTRAGDIDNVQLEPGLRIVFTRDDGQKMRIDEDKDLYSMGSTHPFTGNVTDVKIDWIDDVQAPA